MKTLMSVLVAALMVFGVADYSEATHCRNRSNVRVNVVQPQVQRIIVQEQVFVQPQRVIEFREVPGYQLQEFRSSYVPQVQQFNQTYRSVPQAVRVQKQFNVQNNVAPQVQVQVRENVRFVPFQPLRNVIRARNPRQQVDVNIIP